MVTKQERAALKRAGLTRRDPNRATTLTPEGYEVLVDYLRKNRHGFWGSLCITHEELQRNEPYAIRDLLQFKLENLELTMLDLLREKGYDVDLPKPPRETDAEFFIRHLKKVFLP